MKRKLQRKCCYCVLFCWSKPAWLLFRLWKTRKMLSSWQNQSSFIILYGNICSDSETMNRGCHSDKPGLFQWRKVRVWNEYRQINILKSQNGNCERRLSLLLLLCVTKQQILLFFCVWTDDEMKMADISKSNPGLKYSLTGLRSAANIPVYSNSYECLVNRDISMATE